MEPRNLYFNNILQQVLWLVNKYEHPNHSFLLCKILLAWVTQQRGCQKKCERLRNGRKRLLIWVSSSPSQVIPPPPPRHLQYLRAIIPHFCKLYKTDDDANDSCLSIDMHVNRVWWSVINDYPVNTDQRCMSLQIHISTLDHLHMCDA